MMEADGRGVVIGSRKSGAPLILKYTSAMGTGGNMDVDIKPSAGEFWEIDAISVEHDAAAAVKVSLLETDGTDEMFRTTENIRDVTNAKETPIYPSFYNTGDYQDYIGSTPILASNSVYPVVRTYSLPIGKYMEVNIKYRKVRH